ncbi:type IV pilus assembly protein PilM [Candidatus Sumerlaeota bacterium]
MARPVVGLDVGSSCVKAVQLKRVGKTAIQIEKVGMAEVNPNGPPPGGPAARDAKAQAIKAALAQGGIKAKQVVSSVSGESIIVRYIQLPDMPENELVEALKWEAEEYIPFNIEDVNLGSAILGKTEDGSRVNVLLVAAKKDLIEEHASIIRQAGLQPIIVDVDSFAFLNAFEINCEPDPQTVAALINIGSNVTNINVYHNGASYFSRDIAMAGNSITTAIQSKLGLEWGEAEQLKVNEGAPESLVGAEPAAEEGDGMSNLMETIRGSVEKITGEQSAEESPEEIAGNIIGSSLTNLLSEIRRSIQFFENQAGGRQVNRVVLGGGSARMRNIVEYFNNELSLPVEVLDPLQRTAPGGRDIDKGALESSKQFLGVGIGLALRKVVD